MYVKQWNSQYMRSLLNSQVFINAYFVEDRNPKQNIRETLGDSSETLCFNL